MFRDTNTYYNFHYFSKRLAEIYLSESITHLRSQLC